MKCWYPLHYEWTRPRTLVDPQPGRPAGERRVLGWRVRIAA